MPSCTTFNSVPHGHLLQGDTVVCISPGKFGSSNLSVWRMRSCGHQFEVLAAEGVALAGGEVRERHLVGAADLGVQVVDLAGESVRRKPLGHRVGVEERPIDSFGRGTADW